jgi:UDP-glucose 4-epimerase
VFLVTGGAGFIGSHLVEALLADGHPVRVLDDLSTGKPENLPAAAELVVGDAADRALLATAVHGVSGIFHLAAIASVARGNEDWPGTHRANLGATVAVLDAARGGEQRLPVVYASSAAIYGDTQGAPASEAMMPAPLTAYGADKLGCELHARVARLVHGVPTLGLRFFNVYGPRQDPLSPYSGVISIFARAVARGLPVTLHGDGLQTRDFVFVADVVAHLRAAMRLLREAPESPARVYNVCTGREVSVRDLLELLAALRGTAVRPLHGPARAGDIRHSRGVPAAAQAALGVRADVRLRDGLATLLG